tara:strand:- start:1789 stop:1923 length:135 start_codon:yes stop_codon:yes gene_type:complete
VKEGKEKDEWKRDNGGWKRKKRKTEKIKGNEILVSLLSTLLPNK